jgi:hypothetical protein
MMHIVYISREFAPTRRGDDIASTDADVEKIRAMAHKPIDIKFSANHILPMMEHYYQ